MAVIRISTLCHKVETLTSKMDINNDLVVRSLNYHGQQLTNFVKNLPEFQELQLASVDYGLYQSRSNELRREDRGRRLLVHQFIAQNFNSLFR